LLYLSYKVITVSSNEALSLYGDCDHCGKDLSSQNWVWIAGEKVFCNEKCWKRINYGVTGSDGVTRISSRREDLPKPETIGGQKIVEVEKG